MMLRWNVLVAGVLLTTAAHGQEPSAPDTPTAPPREAPAAAPAAKFAPATRADLARMYLRFERAFRDHPPPPERLAEVNRAFDAATLQFFSGDLSSTVKTINELTDSLAFSGSPTAAARFASSLKVTVAPYLWPMEGEPEITVVQLYGAATAPGPTVRVIALGGEEMSNEIVGSVPLWPKFEAAAIKRKGELSYTAEIRNGDEIISSTRFYASRRSLNEYREQFLARARNIPEASPELAQALSACRARINLLQDAPSSTESAQFLLEPWRHMQDVDRELQQLARGEDPYKRKVGDYWRTFKAAGIEVPCRVYAPAAAADGTHPLPLVVALHGAGGDESMFMEGYGAGAIKQLADRRGFVVVSPLTYMVMGNAAVFDGIVDAAAMTYAIDPARVYVLGHSMGGGAAAGLAVQRPDRLAAACCIAGTGRLAAAKKLPPVLLIAGELDPLIPPDRIKAGAEAAQKAGLPVEVRVATDYGHTLVVSGRLAEAVAWLLEHRKEP